MAKHFQKPFIARILNEGYSSDNKLISDECKSKARELSQKMPINNPDRYVYVKNVVNDALAGKIDEDVFKEFAKISNCWVEIKECLPRLMKQ